MPDATELLIEYTDSDGETRYEHIADDEHAVEYLRQLVGQGKTAILYQRIDFTVQIGVTVKSPRWRRKKEAKEDAGAAATVANGSAHGPTPPVGDNAEGPPPANPASPVYDCEARFADDPMCLGPMKRDPVTRGWFCPIHIGVTESIRHECHAKRGVRNRPVRVAHAG